MGYSGNCTASSCPFGTCIADTCYDYSMIIDCIEQCESVNCDEGYTCSCGVCIPSSLKMSSDEGVAASYILKTAFIGFGAIFLSIIFFSVLRLCFKTKGYDQVKGTGVCCFPLTCCDSGNCCRGRSYSSQYPENDEEVEVEVNLIY